MLQFSVLQLLLKLLVLLGAEMEWQDHLQAAKKPLNVPE
jgi:hypothetical protein